MRTPPAHNCPTGMRALLQETGTLWPTPSCGSRLRTAANGGPDAVGRNQAFKRDCLCARMRGGVGHSNETARSPLHHTVHCCFVLPA